MHAFKAPCRTLLHPPAALCTHIQEDHIHRGATGTQDLPHIHAVSAPDVLPLSPCLAVGGWGLREVRVGDGATGSSCQRALGLGSRCLQY